MSEYETLQILDQSGFPINSNKILFSSSNNILIYSFGSNVIYYNLNNNTKTFLQLFSTNELIILKYFDNDGTILLTISNNSSPIINIWDLKTFENIFNQDISIKDDYGIDFFIENIFIEKISNNSFIILISSINSNDYILYKFYLLNNKFYLEPFFSNINQINKEKNNNNNIIGFKFFLNSQTGIIIYKHSIEFCEFDFDNNNNNDKKCIKKNYINYNFNILPNSYSISNDYNLLAFMTSKGNCLLYDINYNNKTTINPYNQDSFTISFFSQDSLYLGTNNGKIFVYQLSDYKLKYYINYNRIYKFKKEFQINKNIINGKDNANENENEDDFDGPNIDYLYCDENNDKIFIKMGDNSILLSPISYIIDNNNGYINDKLIGNSPLFFAYNHSEIITDIAFFPLSNNEIIDYPIVNDKIQTIFYTCSKDSTLIKYYINHEDNKLYNQYFDFYNIINENDKNIKDNLNLQKNNNESMNYFNIISFHPIQKNYLYIGDQKGCIYILDINKNDIIYKQYIGETYSIDSLTFNSNGKLLCIGLETGMELLFYINNINNTQQKLEKYLLLNNHHFTAEEIGIRNKNNHILSYSYFFLQNQLNENKIIYLKSNNCIECSLIIEKNNNYKQIIYDININGKILDIKMHKGENYLIYLVDNLQIIIYDLLLKKNAGIIDLSSQVKYSYNIDIDISGLYLSLLCQLKDNKNEKSDIVLFELGTGIVHSFISGMSSLVKIKFDYNGKYMIALGTNGEIFLLGLDEDARKSIENVIEELNKNPKFLEDYEILFNNEREEIYPNNLEKDLNKIIEIENENKNTFNHKEFNNVTQNENGKNIFSRNNNNKYNKINNNSSRINDIENNNKYRNKFNNDNNLFNNISNRGSKSGNNKTYPNSVRLQPLIFSQKYKNKYLNTNRNNSDNSYNTNYSDSYRLTNRFNYSYNKYNNIPKLSYINIVNKQNKTFRNKDNSNSYIKTKKEIQIKNINNAINELMFEQGKENDNSKIINKFSFSNNLLNNNLSSFLTYNSNPKSKFHSNYDMDRDLMIINNKRINKSNINNSNNTTFLIYHKDKHKKYPEPKDIDNIENFYYINNNISNLLK